MAIQTFRPTVGGAELQLERLLPHLAARGVSVTVLTRPVPGEPRTEVLGEARVRRLGRAGRSPVASVAYVARSLAWLARRRRSVQIVHAHGAKSPGTIAIGATFLGMAAFVLVIGVGSTGDFERVLAKPGGRLRLRLMVRRATFVALSEEARSEILAHGVPADRELTIPNGVDLRAYQPASAQEQADARARLGIAGEGVIALFVGRLHPVKEVDTLVAALADVPALRLVVVGDGPERHALEAMAARNGVTERIHFVGFSEHVSDYLRASDMLLLPSRREGMSNALLEAMASGLACVASPASGTSELLGEYRGLTAPAGDVAAWAGAMRRLSEDAQLRAELGRRAVEHVRANYSTESAADRLVDAYRSVVM